jgi:DNA repair protein RadD
MVLRPYQLEAHDAVITHIRQSLESSVVVAATGAGKSLIIAQIAKTVHAISKGKSILVLCPNKEILEQNRAKYLATGEPASIFSASLGSKCLRHPVVFGTPQSVKNSVQNFGNRFALIIIDEAHGITPSVKTIVEHFKAVNERVRVVGLTATPYRMGTGLIYGIDDKNKAVSENETVSPYFFKKVYQIDARYLIKHGYLTPPTIGDLGAENYDTSTLTVNTMGKFDSSSVDRCFVGLGRKTASIVADVVNQSYDRNGVIFFASTIKHAEEILSSLPKELSAIVTGETPKVERSNILTRFKAQQIKYIVNVSVLTVGFDAPHIDVVAVLRPTESLGLFQQIIGRGLRLFEGKTDCLLLDYAENIDRHCPDGDLFNPKISVKSKLGKSEVGTFVCPLCKMDNEFSLRENEWGYGINEEGYFTDLEGIVIETENRMPLPAHYGRRCQNYHPKTLLQCDHRWSLKVCEACSAENDITARRCVECKGELIDPNEKLIMEFKQHKKDPTLTQIDEVLDYRYQNTVSQRGNVCIKVSFVTPYRKFDIWLQKEPKSQTGMNDLVRFNSTKDTIKTVEYRKEPTGFYRVLSYNKESDKCTTQNTPNR